MVERWNQVKTNTQKKSLIVKTVKELEDLVALPEVRKLIKKILIARKGRYEIESHQRYIYLTRGKLEEVTTCGGHLDGIALNADVRQYDICEEDGKRKAVQSRSFKRIVEEYKLTPHRIFRISEQLRA